MSDNKIITNDDIREYVKDSVKNFSQELGVKDKFFKSSVKRIPETKVGIFLEHYAFDYLDLQIYLDGDQLRYGFQLPCFSGVPTTFFGWEIPRRNKLTDEEINGFKVNSLEEINIAELLKEKFVENSKYSNLGEDKLSQAFGSKKVKDLVKQLEKDSNFSTWVSYNYSGDHPHIIGLSLLGDHRSILLTFTKDLLFDVDCSEIEEYYKVKGLTAEELSDEIVNGITKFVNDVVEPKIEKLKKVRIKGR